MQTSSHTYLNDHIADFFLPFFFVVVVTVLHGVKSLLSLILKSIASVANLMTYFLSVFAV